MCFIVGATKLYFSGTVYSYTSLSSFFVQMCIFSHLFVTIQINIPWIMLFSVTAYRVGLTEIKCFKCQGKNKCMVDAVLV